MANKTEERKGQETPKATEEVKVQEAAKAAEEVKVQEPPKAGCPTGEKEAKGFRESPSGIWTYIGPNVKGAIHTGKTFRGTRAQVLEQIGRALERESAIQRLIVAGEELSRAREMVKVPGNVLYETFMEIAEKQKKEAK